MPRQHRVVSVVAGLALLTGCGAAPGASTPLVEPAAAAVQEQPSQPVSVNAAGVAGLGTVLTDQGGKTLYLFTKDSKDPSRSTCVGECAQNWPPLMATSLADVQVSGVDLALIGTVERPEGGLQVTVGGWPVYTYARDSRPGQATGQGVQSVWFAVTPQGKRAGAPDVGLTATNIPNFGSALTDQEGRTLYLFTKDSTKPPKSTCNGQCAETWPPMLSTGAEPALSGVDPALVGTVKRADGTEQITVGGWPVYTYVEDTAPGQTNGHGVSGVWFVIEELGCKSTAPVSTDEPQEEEEEAQEEDTGY